VPFGLRGVLIRLFRRKAWAEISDVPSLTSEPVREKDRPNVSKDHPAHRGSDTIRCQPEALRPRLRVVHEGTMTNVTSYTIRITIDALILGAPRLTGKGSRKLISLLKQFAKHFHERPELMIYLIEHLRAQIATEGFASFDAAYADARIHLRRSGGMEEALRASASDYKLPSMIKSLYCRACIRVCPEVNSFLEIHYCNADAIFQTKLAKTKLPGDHGRMLIWPDDPDYAEAEAEPEAQGELFPEAA
jgi:hypothetical protein